MAMTGTSPEEPLGKPLLSGQSVDKGGRDDRGDGGDLACPVVVPIGECPPSAISEPLNQMTGLEDTP